MCSLVKSEFCWFLLISVPGTIKIRILLILIATHYHLHYPVLMHQGQGSIRRLMDHTSIPIRPLRSCFLCVCVWGRDILLLISRSSFAFNYYCIVRVGLYLARNMHSVSSFINNNKKATAQWLILFATD
jgi:hypothetical protein